MIHADLKEWRACRRAAAARRKNANSFWRFRSSGPERPTFVDSLCLDNINKLVSSCWRNSRITEWNHSLRPIRWQHLCALSIQRNSLLSLPNVVKMVAKRENDQLFFGICPKYHHARTQLTIKSESFRRRPFRKQLELVDSTWNSAHSDRAGIRADPYSWPAAVVLQSSTQVSNSDVAATEMSRGRWQTDFMVIQYSVLVRKLRSDLIRTLPVRKGSNWRPMASSSVFVK